MDTKRMQKLTQMLEYARTRMDRCIEEDNPFDASYWWREVNEIKERIANLVNEEAV